MSFTKHLYCVHRRCRVAFRIKLDWLAARHASGRAAFAPLSIWALAALICTPAYIYTPSPLGSFLEHNLY